MAAFQIGRDILQLEIMHAIIKRNSNSYALLFVAAAKLVVKSPLFLIRFAKSATGEPGNFILQWNVF